MNRKTCVVLMGLLAASVLLWAPPVGARPEPKEPFSVEGVVFPEKSVSLSSPLQDKIVEFSIEEGDAVEAGQMIARLDYKRKKLLFELATATFENDSGMKLAKATLEYRKKDLDRAKKLFDPNHPEKSAISAERFDKVSNDFVVAQIAVQQSEHEGKANKLAMDIRKEDLESTKIISPISGILVHKFFEEGEVAQSAKKIANIMSVDKVRVLVHLDVAKLSRVRKGMQVAVAPVRDTALRRTGTVIYIADMVDPASQTIQIKVELDNKDHAIKPGTGANVTFK